MFLTYCIVTNQSPHSPDLTLLGTVQKKESCSHCSCGQQHKNQTANSKQQTANSNKNHPKKPFKSLWAAAGKDIDSVVTRSLFTVLTNTSGIMNNRVDMSDGAAPLSRPGATSKKQSDSDVDIDAAKAKIKNDLKNHGSRPNRTTRKQQNGNNGGGGGRSAGTAGTSSTTTKRSGKNKNHEDTGTDQPPLPASIPSITSPYASTQTSDTGPSYIDEGDDGNARRKRQPEPLQQQKHPRHQNGKDRKPTVGSIYMQATQQQRQTPAMVTQSVARRDEKQKYASNSTSSGTAAASVLPGAVHVAYGSPGGATGHESDMSRNDTTITSVPGHFEEEDGTQFLGGRSSQKRISGGRAENDRTLALATAGTENLPSSSSFSTNNVRNTSGGTSRPSRPAGVDDMTSVAATSMAGEAPSETTSIESASMMGGRYDGNAAAGMNTTGMGLGGTGRSPSTGPALLVAELAPDEEEVQQQLSAQVEREVQERLHRERKRQVIAEAVALNDNGKGDNDNNGGDNEDTKQEEDDAGLCDSLTGAGWLVITLVVSCFVIAIVIIVVLVTGGNNGDGNDLNVPTIAPVAPTDRPSPSPTPIPETPNPASSITAVPVDDRFEYLVGLIGPQVLLSPEGGDISIFNDTSTVHYQAMDWLAHVDEWVWRNGEENQQDNVAVLVERYALAFLYFFTNGDVWTSPAGFLTPTTSVCDWNDNSGMGVFCQNNNDDVDDETLSYLVDRILLPANGLGQSIPNEIGLFPKMGTLILSDNRLDGMIPTQVGLLTDLTNLNLFDTDVGGTIPDELYQLTNMQRLNLENNFLRGTIAPEIGQLSNLQFLSIHDNRFTGQLPTAIGNMIELTHWILGINQFEGVLPLELYRLTKLREFHLGTNRFFGIIPSEIGQLSQLTSLNLDWSSFSGVLPTEIGFLTLLANLQLGNNFALGGVIPSEIGFLTALTNIEFYSNSFSGELPTEMGNLTNLRILRLENNFALSGTVPMSFSSLTRLDTLYLYNTFLTGNLDPIFCNEENSFTTTTIEEFISDCSFSCVICTCCTGCF